MEVSVDSHDLKSVCPWLGPNNNFDWSVACPESDLVVDPRDNLGLDLDNFPEILPILLQEMLPSLLLNPNKSRIMQNFLNLIFRHCPIPTSLHIKKSHYLDIRIGQTEHHQQWN